MVFEVDDLPNPDRFGFTVWIKRRDEFAVEDGGSTVVCGIRASDPLVKVGKAPGLLSGSPGSSVSTSGA